MEVIAKAKLVKVSPRKVRLVAQLLKNISFQDAQNALLLTEKKASKVLAKLIASAAANAVHNAKLKKDTLMVKKIDITEGTPMKRYHPSSRGRAHPYKKRTSHITVILEGK